MEDLKEGFLKVSEFFRGEVKGIGDGGSEDGMVRNLRGLAADLACVA